MKNNSLKIYTAHVRQKDGSKNFEVELVQEGFNWWAFLFLGFWALYRRVWLLLGITILVNLALNFLLIKGIISETGELVASIVIMLWIGVSANDFLRKRLENEGYIIVDIVSGENRARAEQRFFDRNHHIFPN